MATQLLTISEVVERFRLAGIGRDDRSRRSYVRLLMASKPPALVDRLSLPTGRSRAGRNDPRITAASVEAFLRRRSRGEGIPNQQSAYAKLGISGLLARIEQLERELEAKRDDAFRVGQRSAEEIRVRDHTIADLDYEMRTSLLKAELQADALSEVRETRRALENVIIDITGPETVADIL